MFLFKSPIPIGLLSWASASIALSQTQTDHADLWNRAIHHSNQYFIENAWDETSESFHNEISFDDQVTGDTRHLVAASRLVYGLAKASSLDNVYLTYATKQAQFILDHMIVTHPQGPFFKAKTTPTGETVDPSSELVVNKQAYGLNGLVALYDVIRSPELLGLIETLFDAFYHRFYDAEYGGFYDSFNLETGEPTKTKSYNSTVYVATSFLLELAKLDTSRSIIYQTLVLQLADKITKHFLDTKTGWIVENFTEDWQSSWRGWQLQQVETEQGPREYTIGIVGHNFQAAWFLMRAADLGHASEKQKKSYLHAARTILVSMLESEAIDQEKGGVFDAFKREDGQPMWHTNKAWWQQAEAILALAKSRKIGLLTAEQQNLASKIEQATIHFYLTHFIDREKGGEFAIVDRLGTPIEGENKGHLGKSSYHATELAEFMKMYGP